MWERFDLRQLERLHRLPANRQFGLTFAILLTIIIALKQQWLLLAAPALLLLVSIISPQLLQPLNRLWFRLGLILGWLVSPVILALFYFLLFSPMVLVIKLFGHTAFPKKGWVAKTKKCDFTRNF